MEIVLFANDCNVIYIENELHYLLSNTSIDRLIILTEKPLRDSFISNEPRVEIRLYQDSIGLVGFVQKLKIAFEALPMMLTEYFQNKRLYRNLSKAWAKYNELRNELLKAKVASLGNLPQDALFYSYWGAHEAIIMSVLRKKGFSNKNITRLHGFDLYEELENGVPFRWFIRKYIDKYVTISDHGRNYFIGKYPDLKGKTKTCHLGIAFNAKDKLNESPKDVMRVVSCGWVNHHKNYHKIFEALNGMESLEWLHLGGGGIIDEFEAMVNKEKKIKVTFTGLLNREEIFEYYRNTPITCFMSLSSTEGLPVSMMEAQAFGIPIVSSNVGGCGEIVNKETGILLEDNYSIKAVQEAVLDCASLNWSNAAKREQIREHCVRNFSANTNYANFFKHITDDRIGIL